jgi:hypothetical protein
MSRAAGYAVAAVALLATCACAPKADTAVAAQATAASFDPKDFSGTWDRYPQAAEVNGKPKILPNIAVAARVPDPPLKPEFVAAWKAERKKFADATAAGAPIATGYTHCQPDGMPAVMMAMFPMEVLQTKRQTTIIQEAYNQVRRIYLDETLPAIEDAEPGFWGHSVGKWEGNDFVVETVGIKEYVRYNNTPHSANMRIHERMRMLDADHFENEVTVEDPDYLSAPWKWRWVYQRRPNYKMFEYVCEDNREYADPVTGEARLRVDGK